MADNLPPLIIAIDGFSSSGKSSFAKILASLLKYVYIDSGAMYRAVTLFCLREKILLDDLVDESRLRKEIAGLDIAFRINPVNGSNEIYLRGQNVEKEIRGLEVSQSVSITSKIAFLRKRMVEIQRKLGANRSIVMDGRDIGTVVFPEADIKLFMTADPLIRAERRFRELSEKGIRTSLDEVEANIRERDFIDQNRIESPLRKADDAIVLDNSYMTMEDQVEWFKKLLQKKYHFSLQ
jgi:cytidylate kinase